MSRTPSASSHPRPRVLREVSAGGVLVRFTHNSPLVCLIARQWEGRLVWGLPKGHVEAGERLRETAVREVREETGVIGEPVEKLGVITYWFTDPAPGPRHFKTVHFYWLRYVSGTICPQEDEVAEAAWLPLAEAMARVAYVNERRILRKAQARLRANRPAPRPVTRARGPR